MYSVFIMLSILPLFLYGMEGTSTNQTCQATSCYGKKLRPVRLEDRYAPSDDSAEEGADTSVNREECEFTDYTLEELRVLAFNDVVTNEVSHLEGLLEYKPELLFTMNTERDNLLYWAAKKSTDFSMINLIFQYVKKHRPSLMTKSNIKFFLGLLSQYGNKRLISKFQEAEKTSGLPDLGAIETELNTARAILLDLPQDNVLEDLRCTEEVEEPETSSIKKVNKGGN